jgi:hypothetical protein
MRIVLAGILGLFTCICLAQTQEPMPPQAQRSDIAPRPGHPQSARDGGVRETLESIVIPPIPNAPFFATLDTESVKFSSDGASMTFVNERHVGRNSQGQIYEERWVLVPKNSNVKSFMNWIQIADPRKHTLYNCSPQRHVCELLFYDTAADLSAANLHPAQAKTLQMPNGNQTWEDLGTRNILGVNTFGVRETTITNPGVLGNDLPLTSMTEYWHSDRFGLNLLSTRSSPFFGKQTFTITEFNPGEPGAQLFQIPDGYKVNDQRKNPPISQ